MRRALSGWWDHVCLRDGWSAKIGKWEWFALQTVIPAIICLPIFFWIFSGEDGTFPYGMMIMFPIIAAFNIGRWSDDQKKIKKGNAS